MNKLGIIFVFLFGSVVGGGAVWYYLRDKYAQLADDEIASVKEAYARRERERNEEETEPRTEITESREKVVMQTPRVAEKVRKESSVTDYATAAKPLLDIDVREPYVISPEEVGEMDGYTSVCLYYFTDGVLTDEQGIIIDDVEEIVGDALEHLGDYDEDTVYCRNDPKRCDYEIYKDLRTYAEFLETLPRNI